MSDKKLRELERKWKETGSPKDEAALLRATVQAGELSEGRLRLAASLGSEAAVLACLGDGLLPSPLCQDGETAVRAGVAVAYVPLPIWEARHAGRPTHGLPRRVIEAAERWLLDPREENA